MLPLNLSLNDVDTSMPLLAEGEVPLEIKKVEVVERKKYPGAYNLKISYGTVNDEIGTKGESIRAGYPLSVWLTLPSEVTDAEDNDRSNKNLKLFQLAVCGLRNTKEDSAKLPPFDDDFANSLVGKVVIGKIRTSKPSEGNGGEEFGPRSEVASVKANLAAE